jgi:hypothetical protein
VCYKTFESYLIQRPRTNTLRENRDGSNKKIEPSPIDIYVAGEFAAALFK